MKRLIEGYQHFQKEVFPAHRDEFADLSRGQHPEVLFITCADSRIVPNMITQTDPGDIFIVRNVGNIVPPHGEFTGGVTSAIEYGVLALGIKHIVVLGHSDCGAMKGLLHPEKLTNMKGVLAWLQHAQAAKSVVEENSPNLTGDELLHAVTEENVLIQLDHLRTHPSVAARLRRGTVFLHAWIYDIATGSLRTWHAGHKRFYPLGDITTEDAYRALISENSL